MNALRILVIDDSPTQLAAIRKVLTGLGHAVATTSKQEEAQRRLGEAPFDLVIVDYHMPDHDGGEVLEYLRASKIAGAPRFYLYTTDATVASLDQSLGFDGAFLGKGDVELLKAQVGSVAAEIADAGVKSK